MAKPKKRTFIDLFAGCGGLSLGLEYAGFEPVAFTEISSEAKQTYLENRPHHRELLEKRWTPDTWELVLTRNNKLRNKPAKNLKFDRPVDLVVGGPPCQGYSRLGIRRTHEHDRKANPGNFLYQAMAKVVHLANPKIFLFENVQGLKNARWEQHEGRRGEVFQDVLEEFAKLTYKSKIYGYEMRWRLVRAHEYGVPQNRPRLLLIGIRRDTVNHLRDNHPDFGFDSDRTKNITKTLRSIREIRKSKEHQGTKGTDLAFSDDEWKEVTSLTALLEATTDDHFHPEPTNNAPDPYATLSDLVDEHGYPNARNSFVLSNFRDRSQLNCLDYPHAPTGDFQEKMRQLPPWITPPLMITTADESKKWTGEPGSLLLNHEYSAHSPNVVERFKEIQLKGQAKYTNYPNKKFSQRALPREWNGDKPNITITSMPDDYVHYAQPRTLTVREWARLQTFPDWYHFLGNRTTGGTRRAGRPNDGDFSRDVPQYTQIGNAVPPFLAEAVGRHFSQLLDLAEGSS